MSERVWLSNEEFEKRRAEQREEERIRRFVIVNNDPLPDGMKAIIEKDKLLEQDAPAEIEKPHVPDKIQTRYWWNEYQNKTIEDLGNWYD